MIVSNADKPRLKPVQRRALAKPLDSLVFLLPFIIFYEAVVLLGDIRAPRVVAFDLMEQFFALFGTTGFWLPGLAVVIILLATHAAARLPWKIDKRAVGLMAVETIVWSLPLLAVSRYVQLLSAQREVGLADLGVCVGAGIYEELIFRLVLISLLVMIGSDLLRFSTSATLASAVLISAVLFALHHHPPFGGERFTAYKFSFRSLAGVYLGVIFVFRGYGPAAGTHIAYNLITILQD